MKNPSMEHFSLWEIYNNNNKKRKYYDFTCAINCTCKLTCVCACNCTCDRMHLREQFGKLPSKKYYFYQNGGSLPQFAENMFALEDCIQE